MSGICKHKWQIWAAQWDALAGGACLVSFPSSKRDRSSARVAAWNELSCVWVCDMSRRKRDISFLDLSRRDVTRANSSRLKVISRAELETMLRRSALAATR